VAIDWHLQDLHNSLGFGEIISDASRCVVGAGSDSTIDSQVWLLILVWYAEDVLIEAVRTRCACGA